MTKNEIALNKAENRGMEKGAIIATNIFLFVLADKFGFKPEQIGRCGTWCNSYFEDITKGKLKYTDVLKVLKDEYGYSGMRGA